jgi:cephalosporin-C deacetylase-like acetyl esterase
MPSAGFAEIECQLVTSKNKKTRSARYRIGSHVEDIVCPLTRESDFFNFWQDSLAQLASTAPNFQLRPHEQPSQSKVSLFEVSMQSFDNVCVRGWLEIPKQDGLFPTVLRVPGYGQNMKPVGDQEDLIVFSFNPRGHGNSQDDISGKPQDYWVRGLDDRDTYFYRGAYLDCVRAVDFLCTLDKANQQQIAIWGASQGGGFAFATAALDNRIDLCVADIPFLCNWANYFKLTHWDEMDDWLNKKQHRSWAHTLKTMSYFDTMNLCERVTCQTIMNVGLQDQICPPTTSFAAFNRVPGAKTYKIYPARGHGLGKEHQQSTWKQIKDLFRSAKTSIP